MKIMVQIDNTVDENFEKIRKQRSNVFMGTTNLAVAKEWLRRTERILDRFNCTTEKRVTYVVSLL